MDGKFCDFYIIFQKFWYNGENALLEKKKINIYKEDIAFRFSEERCVLPVNNDVTIFKSARDFPVASSRIFHPF